MRGNAKITGNTYSDPFFPTAQGGGVYVAGGTFTMYDNASVSANKASAFTSPLIDFLGNSTVVYSYGGGVYVAGGTFTMNNKASVSGNTASSSLYAHGGGVYVNNSGTFTMNGGIIYGSAGGANANVLEGGTNQGASLYRLDGGTAQYSNGSSILLDIYGMAIDGTAYTDATLYGH
jgi:hypothetical protein